MEEILFLIAFILKFGIIIGLMLLALILLFLGFVFFNLYKFFKPNKGCN